MAGLIGTSIACAFLSLQPDLIGKCTTVKQVFPLTTETLILLGSGPILLTLTIGLTISPILRYASNKQTLARVRKELDLTEQNQQPRQGSNSLEAFLENIQTDNPIKNSRQDSFGRHTLVQRLARRIKETTHPIAIIGARGTGKSSLYNLVREETFKNKSPSLLFTKLSLWPYTTNETAIRGILENATTALSQQINAGPLADLPEKYIEAIAQGGFHWIRIIRQHKPPEQLLLEYNNLCASLGIKLVLWIEDIDRYATSSRTTHEDHLEPVRALLHQLSNLSHTSPVLVASHVNTGFDLEKVFRTVDYLPNLALRSSVEVLEKFIKLETHQDTLDYAKKTRTRLNFSASPNLETFHQKGTPYAPEHAIADLLNTPRSLKNALRLVTDAWNTLRGEIDFDDLLCLCTIQSTTPRVIDVVRDNIRWLRSAKDWNKDDLFLQQKEFRDQVGQAIASTPDALDAIICILGFIFPRNLDTSTRYIKGPQSAIQAPFHADYFLRFLSREVPQTSDQSIIKVVLGSKNTTPSELISHLADTARMAVTFYFCKSILTHQEHLTILRHYAATLVATSSVSLAAPGDPLHSLITLFCYSIDNHEEAVADIMALINDVRTNPTIALRLAIQFTGDPSPLHREGAVRIRELLRDILKKDLVGPDAVTMTESAVLNNPRWMLAHITQHCGPTEGQPPPEWTPLSRNLLSAASRNHALLPCIAQTITADQPRSLATGEIIQQRAVNPAILGQLFPDPNRLLDIFLAATPQNPDSSTLAVQEYARHHLAMRAC